MTGQNLKLRLISILKEFHDVGRNGLKIRSVKITQKVIETHIEAITDEDQTPVLNALYASFHFLDGFF